jgi:hypothetical protein
VILRCFLRDFYPNEEAIAVIGIACESPIAQPMECHVILISSQSAGGELLDCGARITLSRTAHPDNELDYA